MSVHPVFSSGQSAWIRYCMGSQDADAGLCVTRLSSNKLCSFTVTAHKAAMGINQLRVCLDLLVTTVFTRMDGNRLDEDVLNHVVNPVLLLHDVLIHAGLLPSWGPHWWLMAAESAGEERGCSGG